jgi:hypothetical protein
MSRFHCIQNPEIAEIFEEDCNRRWPSKPASVGAITYVDHDSCADSEEENYVTVYTRVSGGNNVLAGVSSGIPGGSESEEEL